MTRKIDLAYAAGILDGEGCIRVKKTQAYRCQGRATPGYHAAIQVRMIHEPAIRFLAELLGGWYWREKSHCNNGRPLYCWQLTDKKAEEALRAVLPYLRVKRDVAETVIALRELQRDGAKHRTKVVGYRNFPNAYGTPRQVATKAFSDEYVARCEAFFAQATELNRVGL